MTDQENLLSATSDFSLEPRMPSNHETLPPPIVDPFSNRPTRSRSRSHSRRSRSSGSRSRGRHRHSSNRRHQSHRSCRNYFRHKERNFAAAISSMIAIVLLCVALVPGWIYLTVSCSFMSCLNIY